MILGSSRQLLLNCYAINDVFVANRLLTFKIACVLMCWCEVYFTCKVMCYVDSTRLGLYYIYAIDFVQQVNVYCGIFCVLFLKAIGNCSCESGYTGPNCETRLVNRCENTTCLNGGTCRQQPSNTSDLCQCITGRT